MTVFATQSSIQFSAPGLAGRAAAGAGKSKLLTASELRGLLGTGSAGLGAKYLADDSTWKAIDLTGYVPYTGATGAVNLGTNALTVGAITASGLLDLQNSTTPQRLMLHSTYTSATSFANLDIRANAGQTAYEISSFLGSAGGTNLPINIGHRNSAGTFTSALSVPLTGDVAISRNMVMSGVYPYFGLTSSSWSGGTFYFQSGVNENATGAGNFTGLINPVTKSFTITSGDPTNGGKKHLTIDGSTSLAVFSGTITTQNGTSPTSIQVHSTYTSATSFANLDVRANAGQTAYEISSFLGSAGGTNLPINIGHRNSAGTFTSALSVATTGICTFVASPYFANDLNFAGGSQVTWQGKSQLRCPGIDGTLRLANNAASAGIQFDVTTNGTLRILDLAGSVSGNLTCAAITASGTITGRASTTAAATAPIKVATGVLMTTPEAGAIEFNGSALSFTAVDVRRSIVVGNDIRVSDTTVANTVTETVLHTSAIAANAMAVGKMYKLTILGKFSTANGASFFTLRSKMGGTTLLTAVKDVGVVTDEHFRSEFWLTIRTIGVSGTYAAHLESTLGTEIESTSPVTGSVDTTAAEDLTLTVEWSAANAGNTITVMQSILEVIN